MKLDRTTYEAWLLDRIEGRLTPDQERELDAFLQANPDLAPEALGELPRVEAGHVAAFDKESLKQDLPPKGSPDERSLDLFLVAQLEGDLSVDQEAVLVTFLKDHPELAVQARRMAAARVPAEVVSLPNGLVLSRTLPPEGRPDRHRLTDFLIAAEEGDLDPDQLDAVEAMIAGDVHMERERGLVRAARMRPEAMVYPDKTSLRRGGRVIPLWSRTVARLAVAASFALLLGLGWMLLRQGPEEDPQIAEQARTTPPERSSASQEVLPVPGKGAQVAPEAAQDETPVINVGPPAASIDGTTGTGPVDQGPASREAPVEHPSIRELPVRMDPLLANVGELRPAAGPVSVDVEELPILAEAPDADAMERKPPTYTPVELLAATVRGRVLEEPDPDTRPLDARDAVAMADRGLGAISGGKAGLEVERHEGRRRFSLKLGNDLAITASSGR